MLIEDHANVRRQLTTLLRAAGLDVVSTASTLAEGWETIRNSQPDVVVLDNHLPDGLGTDLCRRLKEHRPEITTVIYSGHLTWEDDHRARQAGAAAVLPKSFSGAELITAIRDSAHRAPTRRPS